MRYNTGNWLVLAAACVQMIVNAGVDLRGATAALLGFFLGSAPSIAATLGALAFFAGGRRYDQGRFTAGHLWSAVGAALVGGSIVALSRTSAAAACALVAVGCHVSGKLASASAPQFDDVAKWLPLVSRVFAVSALTIDAVKTIAASADLSRAIPGLVLPVAIVAANVIWAGADVELAPPGRAKAAIGRLLGVTRAR